MGLAKIKNSLSEQPMKRMKKGKDWEKIFANHIFDKEIVSRIYKELSKLKCKKKVLLQNGQKT